MIMKLNLKLLIKKSKKIEGNFLSNNIKWTLRQNKLIKDVHKIGDILFYKKRKR